MTLEDLLKQAAARGLTHMALYPVNSLDKQKTYWTATAAPSSGHHYVRGTDLDPVVALKTALTDLPKAKLRAPPAKLKSDVTAAVTEAKTEQEDLTTWLPKT